MKIFNRWGVLVYEKEGYTNSDGFQGISQGRITVQESEKLPIGVYFYVVEYELHSGKSNVLKGWLYLK